MAGTERVREQITENHRLHGAVQGDGDQRLCCRAVELESKTRGGCHRAQVRFDNFLPDRFRMRPSKQLKNLVIDRVFPLLLCEKKISAGTFVSVWC